MIKLGLIVCRFKSRHFRGQCENTVLLCVQSFKKYISCTISIQRANVYSMIESVINNNNIYYSI